MNVLLANTRDGKAHLNKSLIIVPMKEPGVVVVKTIYIFAFENFDLKLPCIAVVYFNQLSGVCVVSSMHAHGGGFVSNSMFKDYLATAQNSQPPSRLASPSAEKACPFGKNTKE